jgi:hypothetical protein
MVLNPVRIDAEIERKDAMRKMRLGIVLIVGVASLAHSRGKVTRGAAIVPSLGRAGGALRPLGYASPAPTKASLRIATTVAGGVSNGSADLKGLYDAHRWFALREAIQKNDAPALYRGAVEAAFNQREMAERDLRKAIAAAPKSDDAFQAHEILAEMFFREGQCKEAVGEIDAMGLLRPKDHSEDGGKIFCDAVNDADQKVVQDSTATAHLQMRDGDMLPVTVKGKQGYYGFDSGSSVSTMSESETRRLGLASAAAGTGAGTALRGVPIQAVVVPRLVIGNITLSDVAFAVFSDKQEPFTGLPEGERGILGLPVLLAMKSFRWAKQGSFEIHPAMARASGVRPNLCLEGVAPAVRIEYAGRELVFGLDTGADATTLYPKFAADFAELVRREGRRESRTGAGYDGTLTQTVTRLPEIALRVGGMDTILRPAEIVERPGPNAGVQFYGNLGMDVMGQAREVTVDFQRMTLTLR